MAQFSDNMWISNKIVTIKRVSNRTPGEIRFYRTTFWTKVESRNWGAEFVHMEGWYPPPLKKYSQIWAYISAQPWSKLLIWHETVILAITLFFTGWWYKNYGYKGFFSKLLAQRGTYRPVELIVGEIGQKFRSLVMKIGDFCKKLANLDIKVRV